MTRSEISSEHRSKKVGYVWNQNAVKPITTTTLVPPTPLHETRYVALTSACLPLQRETDNRRFLCCAKTLIYTGVHTKRVFARPYMGGSRVKN